jgi:N-hydroxyarylamine O-acetyltransferase
VSWPPAPDLALRDALLRRLGFAAPPEPAAETLVALHRAFVERIPYESVWVALGEPRTVDPYDAVRYVMAPGGRGGYCYHLNGTLATLLHWLGFDVHRHVAGVQVRDVDPAGATGNHLALTVRLGARTWLVDAGIGDGPHEPLPLVAGAYRQGPFTYTMAPSTAVPGGWRLSAAPRTTFAGMDFGLAEARTADFADMHAYLSTAPESPYVRVVSAFRRDAAGFDMLRGAVLSRHDTTGRGSTTVATAPEWFAALADVFGITLSDVDGERRAALWSRVRAAHERWLAAQ